MINKLVFLTVFLFFIFSISMAKSVDIDSKGAIKSVSVYLDGALIKKSMKVPLVKGENSVRISGNSLYTNDNTVSVYFDKINDVKILNVKTEKTFLNKKNSEKVEKLNIKIDSLNKQITALNNEKSILNNSINLFQRDNTFNQFNKFTILEFEEYIKFSERILASKYEKIASIDEKLKKLLEEKKSLEMELSLIKSNEKADKTIIIECTSNADIDSSLELSYMVNNVSWKPSYDIKADTSSGKIEVIYYAVVKQSTYEDWNNVTLDISTARHVYGNIPKLTPIIVDFYKPIVKKSSPLYIEALATKSAKLLQPEVELSDEDLKPKVSENFTSFSFLIPKKVNIPSDNEEYRFQIYSAYNENSISYYSAPKLLERVFLEGKTANKSEFPLLSGEMNLYMDGRFINKAKQISTILPGDNFTMSFGVDESIGISRSLKKRFTETVGVFSKNNLLIYEYEIKITNSKKKDVKVNIEDILPKSANESIKVELLNLSQEKYKMDEDNIISWGIELKAGEKKILRYGFKIEYPQDKKITDIE
ncbi:MAG: mucoidy inhibitor MuiA family protein [Calditerrivibrio sp.]|nr:mucoidy inhibitor MuiA family protein [Calditerrivibrio sp.]MCA1932475.1 mucoidy inhibitor MuiA family protein [Calditerrivibrio sp.]MCA1981212.1 mucoidy inhibitor MuiA family protein [Calditerrivibrio sp.]